MYVLYYKINKILFLPVCAFTSLLSQNFLRGGNPNQMALALSEHPAAEEFPALPGSGTGPDSASVRALRVPPVTGCEQLQERWLVAGLREVR